MRDCPDDEKSGDSFPAFSFGSPRSQSSSLASSLPNTNLRHVDSSSSLACSPCFRVVVATGSLACSAFAGFSGSVASCNDGFAPTLLPGSAVGIDAIWSFGSAPITSSLGRLTNVFQRVSSSFITFLGSSAGSTIGMRCPPSALRSAIDWLLAWDARSARLINGDDDAFPDMLDRSPNGLTLTRACSSFELSKWRSKASAAALGAGIKVCWLSVMFPKSWGMELRCCFCISVAPISRNSGARSYAERVSYPETAWSKSCPSSGAAPWLSSSEETVTCSSSSILSPL